jgi:leader peptidase (prepilin peptidase) / N-methyltransferase
VNLILAIPLEARVAALFVLGACLGGLVNLGVYRLAWHPRQISPWSLPSAEAPSRRKSDRIPVLGWLGLRREAGLNGICFWVRPMLVELLFGAGLAALYWWEIGHEAVQLVGVPPPGPAVLHTQFVAHAILIGLMVVGSLIDLDEKIIPDTITIPGALLGLLTAALYPWSMLPDMVRLPGPAMLGALLPPAPANPLPDFLRLTSPGAWPDWMDGCPHVWPLIIGLACVWLWCVGLMHRTWYPRHGWCRAVGLMFARLKREPSTWQICLLGLVTSLGVTGVWLFGEVRWEGLLTSLVGMAAGGGLVWLVRIIGTTVLRKEAMGFGDVTLMAMIGAFLGWQAALMVFFIAPFAGLILGVLNLIINRDTEIPYGPFLCLGALVVIIRWAALWDWAMPLFRLGLFVPLVILVCLGLMAMMLAAWQMVRGFFG